MRFAKPERVLTFYGPNSLPANHPWLASGMRETINNEEKPLPA